MITPAVRAYEVPANLLRPDLGAIPGYEAVRLDPRRQACSHPAGIAVGPCDSSGKPVLQVVVSVADHEPDHNTPP
jgi:hypothetical protein